MGDIDFEVVIINTPLPDEFGHELSTYAVEKSNAGVILLAKAGTADQISDKLQQHGVLVLAKPLPGCSFARPFRWPPPAAAAWIICGRKRQTTG